MKRILRIALLLAFSKLDYSKPKPRFRVSDPSLFQTEKKLQVTNYIPHAARQSIGHWCVEEAVESPVALVLLLLFFP